MGRHRIWRRSAKKAMRKHRRVRLAQERDEKIVVDEKIKSQSPSHKLWLEEQDRLQAFRVEEEVRLQKARNEQWLYEEKLAQERWVELQNRLKRLKSEKAKQELIIKEEWEKEKQKLEREAETRELEKKRKEEEQSQLLRRIEQYIIGDCQTLPSSAISLIETLPGSDLCPFFTKVAACRFGNTCSRNHVRPSISRTLLLPGFYSHFSMDHINQSNEYDTDVGLEYDDKEIYEDFLDFYDDVLCELKTFGPVIQFKVCCNEEPHLKGNVYIQYKEDRYAINAFRALQGRFYGGRRTTVVFCTISSWSKAICGLFKRKKCLKGSKCNFLHVFRNPDREFYDADRDIFHNLSLPNDDKKEREHWNWSPVTESTNRQDWEQNPMKNSYVKRESRYIDNCSGKWSPSPEPIIHHHRRNSFKSKENCSDRQISRGSSCSTSKRKRSRSRSFSSKKKKESNYRRTSASQPSHRK